jgi:hypothetical protein
VEPKGFEPSSSRRLVGFCEATTRNPSGCNRRSHAAAPRVETAGVEPAPPRCKMRRSAVRNFVPKLGFVRRLTWLAARHVSRHATTASFSDQRLDEAVPGCSSSRDAMSAVANVEDVTVADQPHGRCVAPLLEPSPVELHCGRADTARPTRADADFDERNPGCPCENVVWRIGPSFRV